VSSRRIPRRKRDAPIRAQRRAAFPPRQEPWLALYASDRSFTPLLLLGGACAAEVVGHAVVAFMAGVFIEAAVNMNHVVFARERLHPGLGIVDGELICNRVGVDSRKALGYLGGIAHLLLLDHHARLEVHGFHHESIAFPMADRISHPTLNLRRAMRTAV